MKENSEQERWPYGRHRDFELTMRKAAAAWFARQGYPVAATMPYCLASRRDWTKNIVDPAAVQFVQEQVANRRDDRAPFPLHKYVHHGLSSQALLFNLIGPLAARKDLTPLQSAFEAAGISWPASGQLQFEFVDRAVFNERQVQPTSIDLVIGDTTAAGALFIECKLVESEFGGCSLFEDGDCEGANPFGNFGDCYLHHIGRTYLTAMQEMGVFQGALTTDSLCPLANHYQFYRELLLAVRKNGSFILLADERSPVFISNAGPRRRGTWTFLLARLPEHLKSRVGFVSIQGVVREIEASGRHPWIVSFKDKYGLA